MLASPAIAQSPKVKELKTPQAAQIHAKSQLKFFGWSSAQWGCLKELWTSESNWRPAAKNHKAVIIIKNGKRVKVYAGGIPQILGLDPSTPVRTQINKGLIYIKVRYETPCNSLAFHHRHNWY